MSDQLLGIARQRPPAMVIRSEMGAIEETYASLIKTLL
jgi:hypothetical protein